MDENTSNSTLDKSLMDIIRDKCPRGQNGVLDASCFDLESVLKSKGYRKINPEIPPKTDLLNNEIPER